jgi:hypothetical protein
MVRWADRPSWAFGYHEPRIILRMTDQEAGRGVGYLLKQTAFAQRHEQFFALFPSVKAAIDAAFDRTIMASGNLDPLIFYLGLRSVEDFEAIVVLAANDLALAAQSLLRSMYERLVTAAHLHTNPEEATAFAEFDYVQRRRLANAVRDTLGYSPESAETLEEFEREYQRVKQHYEVACGKCGARRVGPGWSKLDFVTQAKRQARFAPFVVHAYYLPLQQAHSTLRSASSLLQLTDGQVAFKQSHAKLADDVFRLAHVLLLHGLYTQYEHFRVSEIDAALTTAMADYMQIYPSKKTATRDTPE